MSGLHINKNRLYGRKTMAKHYTREEINNIVLKAVQQRKQPVYQDYFDSVSCLTAEQQNNPAAREGLLISKAYSNSAELVIDILCELLLDQ